MATVDIDSTGEEQSYYAKLVHGQKIASISSFELESGIELKSVPVAYKTWGALNETRDNVLVLCHALSGSSDAEDWWRPLMGRQKTFDYDRFFVFCGNMLGSPYGSASPLTLNPETGCPYGPEFPVTTARDDVRIHKLVLDALGVSSVAAVIGGSMGGFSTLEWPLCTPLNYIKTIIPITTSAYHSAWGISWGEAQRQCIYADRKYNGGWYDPVPSGQPAEGLGAARMIGMLTYRSYQSFDKRFARKAAKPKVPAPIEQPAALPTPSPSTSGGSEDGIKDAKQTPSPTYAAQSYMQYQAEKFLQRFDANCYLAMTTKMDTHDVTRDRVASPSSPEDPQARRQELRDVLAPIPKGALVISVDTDVLFRRELQRELADVLPNARFAALESPDGHDGFLLEFESLGALITSHLREYCPDLYEGNVESSALANAAEEEEDENHRSVFGEQEPEF